MLKILKIMQNSGKYNFEQCRIKINFNINVEFMRTNVGKLQRLMSL